MRKTPTLLLAISVIWIGCSLMDGAVQTRGDDYLRSSVSPCSVVESRSVDPCEPRSDIAIPDFVAKSSEYPEQAPSMLERLDKGYPPAAIHIVVRGVFKMGTTRCDSAAVIRPLYLDEENPFPGFRHLICHSEFSVSEYVAGSGPAILTIATTHVPFHQDHYDNNSEVDWEKDVEFVRAETARKMEGIEWVLMIAPIYTIAVEGWATAEYWDVQKSNGGAARVVSSEIDAYPPTIENTALLDMPLQQFREEISSAFENRASVTGGRISSDVTHPRLATDANQLRLFYEEMSAYEHTVVTPAPPPSLQR